MVFHCFFVDVRVDNWLFMSSPLPTLLICTGYVLIVKHFGPKFMENRPAYDLRHVLVFYNAFQVLLSAWLFYEVKSVLKIRLPSP